MLDGARPHDGRAQLADVGQDVLAVDALSGQRRQSADLLLQERIQFLHHQQHLYARGELRHQTVGEGIGHAELENGRLGEGLPRVLVGHSVGDDPQAAVLPEDVVDWAGLGILAQPPEPLLQGQASPAGVGGEHHVLGRIGHEATGAAWLTDLEGVLGHLHHRLGMGDAAGGAQDDRCVELLAELEGDGHHVEALLAVGGLEQGDLGELGVVAVVLFALGRVHARVVGADEHQPGVGAGVGGGEEGVGGHVEADVLHGNHGARAAQRRPRAHLQGYLLVD